MTDALRIIYEDRDILVCHKKAGMATEGAGAGRMDLVSAARNYLARKQRSDTKGRQRNLPPYVATVNRLDAPVEGVLVLALNKKAASDIAAQIKDKKTQKYYYALCYGHPDNERGYLSDNLIRRDDTGLAAAITDEEAATYKDGALTLSSKEKVRLIGGEIKKAELEYEVIGRTAETSLLRIHLLTGRFHQIRAQLSSRNLPIVGDDRYAGSECREYSKEHGVRAVCLVSYSFSFKHPTSGKKETFEIVPDNTEIKKLLSGAGA